MKLLFTLILFPFLSVGMQDPKNMSREQFEDTLRQQRVTIAEQQFLIKKYERFHKLHYGHRLCFGTISLERADA